MLPSDAEGLAIAVSGSFALHFSRAPALLLLKASS